MLDIDISGHQVQKSYAQFRGPRNIMLDITKRCNFFCKHCYNESASYYTGDLDDENSRSNNRSKTCISLFLWW